MFSTRCFRYIILLLLITLPFTIEAQLSIGGIPRGKYTITSMRTEIIEMPTIDTVDLLNREKQNKTKAFIFGYNFNTNISVSNHGIWHDKGSSNQYWDLIIQSNRAYSLSILFKDFKLKAGEKLFVYNQTEILGAFTETNNHQSGILAIAPIRGDNVIIEFSTPYDDGNQGSFNITNVSHAYKDIYALPAPGSCNININCTEGNGWQTVKRAVCKLIIIDTINKNTISCSGTLINNAQNNSIPYLLTANHCISTDDEAAKTVVYFDYESASCYGNTGNSGKTLSGSYLRSTLYEGDFTLLELYNHPIPSFKPYYAGWTKEYGSNMDTVVAIHHPQGAVKKISISKSHPFTDSFLDYSEAPRTTNNFWRIAKWDAGVTEEGSSGCALFDINGRIVGSLTGGGAKCGSPFKDYFSKFTNNIDVSILNSPRMSHWLNPDSLDISTLNGFDPYNSENYNCDTFSHVYPNENEVILPYQKGIGYNTGKNSDSIAQYAEKFYSNDTNTIELSGAIFKIHEKGTNGIIINVYKGNEIPETKVFETYVSYSNMQDSAENYFEFYPSVKVQGNFFVSYKIFYQPNDTFAVYQTLPDENKTNSAYLFADGSWQSFNKYFGYSGGTSLDIEPISCKLYTSSNASNSTLKVYPNPNKNNYLYSELPFNASNITKVEICDLLGRTIRTDYILNGNVIQTNVAAIQNGVYFLRIFTTNKVYSAKFLKVK